MSRPCPMMRGSGKKRKQDIGQLLLLYRPPCKKFCMVLGVDYLAGSGVMEQHLHLFSIPLWSTHDGCSGRGTGCVVKLLILYLASLSLHTIFTTRQKRNDFAEG